MAVYIHVGSINMLLLDALRHAKTQELSGMCFALFTPASTVCWEQKALHYSCSTERTPGCQIWPVLAMQAALMKGAVIAVGGVLQPSSETARAKIGLSVPDTASRMQPMLSSKPTYSRTAAHLTHPIQLGCSSELSESHYM